MTDDQMAIYQEQVDEFYEKFVEIVSEGRDMAPDAVRTLADGRTYTDGSCRCIRICIDLVTGHGYKISTGSRIMSHIPPDGASGLLLILQKLRIGNSGSPVYRNRDRKRADERFCAQHGARGREGFARNTMEYAIDLQPSFICTPSYRSNSA